MNPVRFTFGCQAGCGAFVVIGLLVAAFAADREAAGMIIAMQAALPLALILPFTAIGSVLVLINGNKTDRIRLGIWYALVLVLICLFVFLDVLNDRPSAIIGIPVAAAVMIAPTVWLVKGS